MKTLSIFVVIAAVSIGVDAQWGYYYPYSYSYYPYSSWGWWGKRGNEQTLSKRTECIFVQNDYTFKCRGPLGEVECEAEWKMHETLKMEMFGIGKPIENSKMVKLFPRKLDNSAWLSNMVKVDGEDYNVTMHQGESNDLGIKINEKKCFIKIGELLKDSTRMELIHLADSDANEYIVGDFSVIIRSKRDKGKYDDDDDGDEKFSEKDREYEMEMMDKRNMMNSQKYKKY